MYGLLVMTISIPRLISLLTFHRAIFSISQHLRLVHVWSPERLNEKNVQEYHDKYILKTQWEDPKLE